MGIVVTPEQFTIFIENYKNDENCREFLFGMIEEFSKSEKYTASVLFPALFSSFPEVKEKCAEKLILKKDISNLQLSNILTQIENVEIAKKTLNILFERKLDRKTIIDIVNCTKSLAVKKYGKNVLGID